MQKISSICSGDMADIKMLQSHWLRLFWPISKESDFPTYEICPETQ